MHNCIYYVHNIYNTHYVQRMYCVKRSISYFYLTVQLFSYQILLLILFFFFSRKPEKVVFLRQQ